jgi:5-hydroxyisourate hydrolase
MAKISTHMLDIAKGKPAAGVKVELHFAGALVATAVTNADGRTDAPLLAGDAIPVGRMSSCFMRAIILRRPAFLFWMRSQSASA